MSTAAIIAEYNPFHTGHMFQIQKLKELTGCDSIIIIMSGNYVQRGTPAIFDKYTRTKMALNCGADVVIELPVFYSNASSEYFGYGAVDLIQHLGCVDYLCFGCETDNAPLLNEISRILAEEPEDFQKCFKEAVSDGLPYAKCKEKAILSCIDDRFKEEASGVLSKPNCILGIEYLKALKMLHSSIQPVIIKRNSDYHSNELGNVFASSSAIRNNIINDFSKAENYIPSQIIPLYGGSYPLTEDDFSDYLLHNLIFKDSLDSYMGISAFLGNRISNLTSSFTNFTDFADLLSGKHITTSGVRRGLMHIILDIKKEDIINFSDCGTNLYIRLLGFNKEKAHVLKEINVNSSIPFISKMADSRKLLSDNAYKMLMHNVKCDDLYRLTLCKKYNLKNVKTEFNYGIITV